MLLLNFYRITPKQMEKGCDWPTEVVFDHVAVVIEGLLWWLDSNKPGKWWLIESFPRNPDFQMVAPKYLNPSLNALKALDGVEMSALDNIRYYKGVASGDIVPSLEGCPTNCLKTSVSILKACGFMIPDTIITPQELAKFLWQSEQMGLLAHPNQDVPSFLKD